MTLTVNHFHHLVQHDARADCAILLQLAHITEKITIMSAEITALNEKLDAAALAATEERAETQAAFASLEAIIAELRAGSDLTESLAKADVVIASIKGIYTPPPTEPVA